MDKTILLIGTMDTKEEELLFCRELILRRGFKVLLLDAGILKDPRTPPDVTRQGVARAAGVSDLESLLALGNKGKCIATMIQGVTAKTRGTPPPQCVSRDPGDGRGTGDGHLRIGHAERPEGNAQTPGFHDRLG